MSWFRWDSSDLLLQVRIQPGASCSEVVGLHADHLKLRIHAPPIDGRANAELILFLSRLFDVPRQHIHIMRGALGRTKALRIQHPDTLPAELQSLGLDAGNR